MPNIKLSNNSREVDDLLFARHYGWMEFSHLLLTVMSGISEFIMDTSRSVRFGENLIRYFAIQAQNKNLAMQSS